MVQKKAAMAIISPFMVQLNLNPFQINIQLSHGVSEL